MKLLRAITIPAFCLMMAAGASAQISLTPPAAQTPAAKSRERHNLADFASIANSFGHAL